MTTFINLKTVLQIPEFFLSRVKHSQKTRWIGKLHKEEQQGKNNPKGAGKKSHTGIHLSIVSNEDSNSKPVKSRSQLNGIKVKLIWSSEAWPALMILEELLKYFYLLRLL